MIQEPACEDKYSVEYLCAIERDNTDEVRNVNPKQSKLKGLKL